MTLPEVPRPKELRKYYNLRAKRGIGQHFLTDPDILRKIAGLADIEESKTSVIEIGMGPGYLSAYLYALNPYRLIPLEMDQHFFELHQQIFRGCDNLVVHYGDALEMDFQQVLEKSGAEKDLVIVGNIPYQITSPLLFKIWESDLTWRKVVFTVQKEVAIRLACGPGTKDYGVFTIKAQYYCNVKLEFELNKMQFIPPPKVDSAVVSLKPKAERRYSGKQQEKFFNLINSAFSQRRKTVVNSIMASPPFGIEKADLINALEKCEVNPTDRAETISLEQYYQLFELMI